MDSFILRLDKVTYSPQETAQLGVELAKILPQGSIIGLIGSLGAGKSVFVRGLAKGAGVSEEYFIASPTFTIINEYPGRMPFYHLDLYRINSEEELDEIGIDDILREGAGLVAIEWAEKAMERLPEDFLELRMEILGDDVRHLTLLTRDKRWESLWDNIRGAFISKDSS